MLELQPFAYPGLLQAVKDMLGGFELTGLGAAWDNDPEIRERVRKHKKFMLASKPDHGLDPGFVQKTVLNLKANKGMLMPVLDFMRENDKKIPAIDDVAVEVKTLFERSGLEVDATTIFEQSWAVRRLLTYTKSFTYKQSVPQDTDDISKYTCLLSMFSSCKTFLVAEPKKAL